MEDEDRTFSNDEGARMKGISPGLTSLQKSPSFHELRQVQVSSDPRKVESLGHVEKLKLLHAVIKELTVNATSQKKPQAHIVTGQMGAGKSTAINSLAEQFKGNCVIVDYDDLKRFVPGYAEAAREGYPGTVPGSKEIARYLEEGLKQHGFENRLNMVIQKSINSRNDEVLTTVKASKEHDYRVSLNILAVDKSTSTMGVFSRYESGLKDINEEKDSQDGARRTPMEYHEDAYVSTANPERYEKLVPELDEVVVSGRAGDIYYRATTDISPDKIVAAIEQGRQSGKCGPAPLFEKLSALVSFNAQFANPELRDKKI